MVKRKENANFKLAVSRDGVPEFFAWFPWTGPAGDRV